MAKAKTLQISEVEQNLIQEVCEGRITKTVSRSNRMYDIHVEGVHPDGYKFSAWLPLAAIRKMAWTAPKVALMSDYPEMVMAGDWSGIRDSSHKTIWRIFKCYFQNARRK